MEFGSYQRLLEFMKVVEWLLEIGQRVPMIVDERQFGFMPGKEPFMPSVYVRKLQESYIEKEVLHVLLI